MARIVWAEDGLDDQYLIRHALSLVKDPPQVQFVEDGRQALTALGERTPDLVVLDVNMPVLDGVETLRRLRGQETLCDLPVVVFSTGREEEAVDECLELGALEYIQKPFHYNDFGKAVDRICDMARTSAAARRASHR